MNSTTLPRRTALLVFALLWLAGAPGRAAKFTGEAAIQAQPLSPAEALERFRLEEGLRVELVAAEPLAADPVEIAFDEPGKMFVVEASGYNAPTGAKPRSRIRILEDLDGDGRMDRATIFADDLDFAQGVLPIKGGLLVTTNFGILFLRDTDGDGKADVQEVLFRCAPSSFVDHQMASPRRGIDNWIYIDSGLDKQEIYRPAQPERMLAPGSHNFRYHPGTNEVGLAFGRGQFGNTFDDWGRQFFSTNRNPAMCAVLPHRFLVRHPQAFLTEGHEDVAPAGGDAKVYPLKSFRTTSGAHAGTFPDRRRPDARIETRWEAWSVKSQRRPDVHWLDGVGNQRCHRHQRPRLSGDDLAERRRDFRAARHFAHASGPRSGPHRAADGRPAGVHQDSEVRIVQNAFQKVEPCRRWDR